MLEDYKYLIALGLINGVGPVTTKLLVNTFGSAEAVFGLSQHELSQIDGISSSALRGLGTDKGWALERASREMDFIDRHNVVPIAFNERNYPKRLLADESAPAMLFSLGQTDLNASKVLSIVGTRRPTQRGKDITTRIVTELAERYPNLLIVSGLAYGIDVVSHRAALACGLPTVGVVAHGLNTIYPRQHRETAAQMTRNGCVLTEYVSGVEPEAVNFVSRNRIVAAMADGTLVVESGASGGSLITASDACEVGREVMAIPGSPMDEMSRGCNKIIRSGMAHLVESASDIESVLGWEVPKNEPTQGSLFENVEENDEERRICEALLVDRELPAGVISTRTGLPMSQVSSLLLDMEFSGKVKSLPGNIYRLLK